MLANGKMIDIIKIEEKVNMFEHMNEYIIPVMSSVNTDKIN